MNCYFSSQCTRCRRPTLLTTICFTSTLTDMFIYVKSFSSNIRSSHQRWSIKKGATKNFAKYTCKKMCRSLFLIKLQASGLQPYLEREPVAQVFSFEFCEIFKNTYFTKHLRTTTSEIWKVPIFPNLQKAASVFISDKLDCCTNVPVHYEKLTGQS